MVNIRPVQTQLRLQPLPNSLNYQLFARDEAVYTLPRSSENLDMLMLGASKSLGGATNLLDVIYLLH